MTCVFSISARGLVTDLLRYVFINFLLFLQQVLGLLELFQQTGLLEVQIELPTLQQLLTTQQLTTTQVQQDTQVPRQLQHLQQLQLQPL